MPDIAYAPLEIAIAHGTQIAWAATSGGTYTGLPATTEIGLPEAEVETTDITNNSSPGYTKEYKPGLIEPGTVTFNYRYAKTLYAALDVIFVKARVTADRVSMVLYWKITLVDGSTCIFPAFMTKHQMSTSQDEVPEVEVELQVTGPAIFTAGT